MIFGLNKNTNTYTNKLPSNRFNPTTVSWTQFNTCYRLDTPWKRKITRSKRLGRPYDLWSTTMAHWLLAKHVLVVSLSNYV